MNSTPHYQILSNDNKSKVRKGDVHFPKGIEVKRLLKPTIISQFVINKSYMMGLIEL